MKAPTKMVLPKSACSRIDGPDDMACDATNGSFSPRPLVSGKLFRASDSAVLQTQATDLLTRTGHCFAADRLRRETVVDNKRAGANDAGT
jgi:hypothetical protein